MVMVAMMMPMSMVVSMAVMRMAMPGVRMVVLSAHGPS